MIVLPEKSLGLYKIDYLNGVVQYKHLIKHSVFVALKPLMEEVNTLKGLIKKLDKKGTKTPGDIEQQSFLKDQLKQLKSTLKNQIGEYYFTDESPIFKAINTNIIELPHSSTNCRMYKLTETELQTINITEDE